MAKHAQRLDSNKSWKQPRRNVGGHSPFAPRLLLVLPQLVALPRSGLWGSELPPSSVLSSLTRQHPALQMKDARQVARLKGC
jgi:hypothetical protein